MLLRRLFLFFFFFFFRAIVLARKSERSDWEERAEQAADAPQPLHRDRAIQQLKMDHDMDDIDSVDLVSLEDGETTLLLAEAHENEGSFGSC